MMIENEMFGSYYNYVYTCMCTCELAIKCLGNRMKVKSNGNAKVDSASNKLELSWIRVKSLIDHQVSSPALVLYTGISTLYRH